MKRLWILALALVALGFTPLVPAAQAQQPDLQLSGLTWGSPATLHCGSQTVRKTVRAVAIEILGECIRVK